MTFFNFSLAPEAWQDVLGLQGNHLAGQSSLSFQIRFGEDQDQNEQ